MKHKLTVSPPGSTAARVVWLTILLAATGLSACRAVTMAYGDEPSGARANADALATALEQRYTNVVRTPKFANARMRIGRYALAPSKLANDTALWTALRTTPRGAERDLEVRGALRDGAYTFNTHHRAPAPDTLGESRHYIGLTQLNAADDWQWVTSVSNAIGPLPPHRADDIARALFLSAERPAAAVRADYRSAFPRSAAALGRLFRVDSVNTTPQADGSTLVALHLLFTDEPLQRSFPALAKFVRKYVAPARYRVRLSDDSGSDYFDLRGARSRLIVRFRSRGGELQPLQGPARGMSDTLVLHAEASAKLSIFTVGMSDLIGEFVHVDTPSERMWSMRFTAEPHWDLPLIGERLLSAPLKRPFEGEGARLRIGFVRDPARDPRGQTLLTRTSVIAVRESAIMRFLGNLGFTAMSDYAGDAEAEENRFLAEAFAALRQDIAAQ